ncbi:MAG: InlB B-repeat-containing protein [Firmicutes bacterium]|nr:InlB B-repeat-containing protein [Bacillota bacterium]
MTTFAVDEGEGETAVTSSGAETVTIDSTLGAGSLHEIDLGTTSSYNLTIDVTAQSLASPKLVITVPKDITVTYYPTASNATLAGSLALIANPVTKTTDSDGKTVLAYHFKENVTTVGFNITLAPTYKLKPGNDYTVAAILFDDIIEQATEFDTITITGNPTLKNGAYSVFTSRETIILRDDADYYYARANGYLRSTYSPTYDYDSLEVIVPLPDEAVPGYYNGSEFALLEEGVLRSFADGSVRYEADYDFITAAETTVASGKKALVYTLSANHSLVNNTYTHYYYNDNMGGIYLRFPGSMTNGDYRSPCSAAVRAYIDNDTENYVVLRDFGSASTYSLYYTFKAYNLQDFFYNYITYSYNSVYSANHLLNIEDNYYFYDYFHNKTGEVIENINVEYTIPQELNCYKLEFTLNSSPSSHYPSSAVVQYRTEKNPTLQTATLTADDATFLLGDSTDSLTYVNVVYDKLGVYNYSSTLMKGYVVNRDNVDSSTGYPIYSQILSAEATGSISDVSIAAQLRRNTTMYLKQKYEVVPGYLYLNRTTLNKGDSFSAYFRLTGNNAYVTNPTIYLLMPSEFIFSSYTNPYPGAEYTISQRSITVTEDTATMYVPPGDYILYTIQYTDGIAYINSSYHNMYFTVGPEVDTATLRTGVYLPAAVAVTSENTTFPYSQTNTNYVMQDRWDFDEDNDTTEKLPTMNQHPTVTINAVRSITAQSFVTSSYSGSGENITQSYQHHSTGHYKLYIYNGLESGNTAKNSTITINVPKTDFNNENMTSQWGVTLTGAPVLNGAFLADATLAYSTDGGATYTTSVSDYSEVTNIKLETEPEVALESSESASISLPFTADFPQNIGSSSKAYFDADFSYYHNSYPAAVSADISPNMLTVAPVNVSGAVFKDFNANGIQDSDEQNNYKYYNVTLYKGEYTDSTTGLTYLTSTSSNYYTGAYSLNQIYLPGMYTVRVMKTSDEYFPSTGEFTPDGSTNYAYYTFTVNDDTNRVDSVNLGIVAPRTMNLNYSSLTLFEQGPIRKILPTVAPVLSDLESITYTSSDVNVVTVAPDGTLTYVGDGNAVITVSVPQISALQDIFSEAPVTANVHVYARKTSYSILYKDHNGNSINTSLTEDYADYKSYTYGSTIGLPTAEPYSRSGYTFSGWYTAQTGGNKVSNLSSSTYGDQAVYARWTADSYAITYEGMEGASYGVYHPAQHTYGTVTPVSDATKKGYDFVGWKINQSTTAAKSITLGAADYTDAITLTAVWSLAAPVVNISTDAINDTVTYGSDITISAAVTEGENLDYSYEWFSRLTAGADISLVADNRTLTLAQVEDSGQYYCRVTVSDATQSAAKNSSLIAVTINRANGSITNISDISKNYDGSPVSAPDYTIEGDGTVTLAYKKANDLDTAYNVSAPVDAGEYIVRIRAAQGSNHHEVSETKDFTISPRIITVTPIDGQTKVYSEADPLLTYSTNAASAVVDGENIMITGAPVRATGENVGTYLIGLGTLTLGDGVDTNGFRAANYQLVLSETASDFTILSAAMDVFAAGYSGTYDGQFHGITVSAPAGATIYYKRDGGLWSQDKPLFKDVVSAVTVTYKVEKPNYTTIEDSRTVTVIPRPITIAAGSNSKTYDGTTLAFDGYSVNDGTLAFGDSISTVTMTSESTIIDYGTTDNVIDTIVIKNGTADVTSNYDLTTQAGTLTINKRAITITADSNEKVYDQTALTDSGYSITSGMLVAGDTVHSVDISGTITDVGTASNIVGDIVIMRGLADATANYDIMKVEGTLTVSKRHIEITADSASGLYNGTLVSANRYSITGELDFPAGEGFESVTVEGSQTLVGSSRNQIIDYVLNSDTIANNYVITAQHGTLTVEKAEIPITITAASDKKMYDGTPLIRDLYTLHNSALAEGDTLEVAVAGSITDYGSTDNNISSVKVWHGESEVTENYIISKVPGKLEITKRSVLMTAKDNEKVYDGSELQASGYALSGDSFITGEGLTSVRLQGKQLFPGTSSTDIIGHSLKGNTKADNYEIKYIPGVVTVTKAQIPITVKASHRTAIYNGTPLSDDSFTVEGTLATEDSVHATVIGSRTKAGTDENLVNEVAVLHTDGTDVSENYVITSVSGTLTVEPKPYASASFVISPLPSMHYTGESIRPKPLVKGNKNALKQSTDYTLAYQNNIYPGTALVTIQFKGNYSGTTTTSFLISDPVVKTGIPVNISKNRVTFKGGYAHSAINLETGFYYKKATDATYSKLNVSGTDVTFESTVNDLAADTEYVYYTYVTINGLEYTGKVIRCKTTAEPVQEQPADEAGKINVGLKNDTEELFTVTISIEDGNTVIASTAAQIAKETDFSHSFTGLADGFYNIVVRIGDFTETKKVQVAGGLTERVFFNIKNTTRNTAVEINGKAPNVAVGGMTALFDLPVSDGTRGVTLNELESATTIQVKVVADEISVMDLDKAREMDMIKDYAENSVGMFIDFSVIKTITDNDGTRETLLSEVPGLLEIAIPIPEELLAKNNFVIYRVHDGIVEAITETKNENGEFIEVNEGYIILYAKKFSTYAIGYTHMQISGEIAARAIDITSYMWALLIFLTAGLYILIRKRRQEESNKTV